VSIGSSFISDDGGELDEYTRSELHRAVEALRGEPVFPGNAVPTRKRSRNSLPELFDNFKEHLDSYYAQKYSKIIKEKDLVIEELGKNLNDIKKTISNVLNFQN
jgi:hypothetical protein